MAIPRDYFRYWGKAGDETDGDIDWHPLVYHGLDVAASARVLMRSQPAWLDSLSRSCELDPAALYKWISFLMAIHDIGKFGQGFQSLRPELQRQLQGIQTVAAYDTRHDTLGYALLLDSLQTWLDRDPDDDLELDLLQPWVSAVTGHHGRPPVNKRTKPIVLRHFANPAREAARQFVQDIRHLLMPDWCLPEPAPGVAEQQRRCSWLVAGPSPLPVTGLDPTADGSPIIHLICPWLAIGTKLPCQSLSARYEKAVWRRHVWPKDWASPPFFTTWLTAAHPFRSGRIPSPSRLAHSSSSSKSSRAAARPRLA